jgi:hypothetical protein
MNYSDFFIYNTIEIQKTDIISILKRNIFDAIPADFWIKPIMNYSPFGTGSDLSVEAESLAHSSYKPTLVIQDVLLEDEFYTPNYKIPELIVRGETEPQLTGLQKFNSQKVMKPGIIGKTYVLEINDAKTATSDVPSTPSEIPIPTQELSVMYSYRWHPIIPLIWIEQIAGINMVKQGTVNDVTYFQDSNYNLTITETQTFEWQPGQNIRPLTEIFDSISYPNGFTGVRSGTLQFTSGAVINIILWDEPYFEQPNQYQQVI